MNFKIAFSTLAALCLFFSLAEASLITSTASNSSDHTAFDSNASNSDLVNTGQSTLASAVTSGTFFGPGGHNNGVAANNGTDSSYFGIAPARFPAVLTYTLDTSVNTLGYDITTIRSITGWDANSTTHANQEFDVEVSVVGSPLFSTIGSVNFTPFAGGNGNKSSMVTLTDSTGTIASGVDQLRFTYSSTGTWGTAPGLVLRELDVEGIAVVPEPSSALVLSFLGMGLLARRKRRKV